MAWLVLGVAVVTEIIWALSLKWAGVQATWQAARQSLEGSAKAVENVSTAE